MGSDLEQPVPGDPKVSIGLSFYNPGTYLRQAIQSIFAQTLANWELVLVDDGSTDGSVALVQSIRDSRVRLIRGSRRRGLAHRLNEIASAALAPFLARMDADDMMHPKRLAVQLAALEGQPNLDLVATGAFVMDGCDRVYGTRYSRWSDTSHADVFKAAPLIHPTVFGRREWFLNNPYSENFERAEDFELWCRALDAAGVLVKNDLLYFYRDAPPLNVRDYRQSQTLIRDAIRVHASGKIGNFHRVCLLIRSELKEAAVSLAQVAGVTAPIVYGRSIPISSEESARAGNALSTILACQVPGWGLPVGGFLEA